ncbi:hypothetical protein [Atlantibacter hermannii]|uniref:hypothetical protein n=1 Tax=Atlantibacter hermannii TaxID=565 RepID=UPI003075FB50
MAAASWFSIAAGAAIGACLAGFWSIIKDILNRRSEAKSLRKGLIAEVQTIDHIMKVREYRTILESLILQMKSEGKKTHRFGAYIGENFNPVYMANMDKIGLLPSSLGSDIVRFHAYIYAITCDFHEKSMFTKEGYDIETVENMVDLLVKTEQLACSILSYK